MKRLIILTIFTLLTVESFGCKCVYVNTKSEIRRLVETSDYIFTGTASKIIELDNTGKDSLFLKSYLGQDETKSPFMTFSVSETFKGSKDEMINIEQDLTTCTQTFLLNEKYLIFGQRKKDGTIDTSTCSSFYFDKDSKFIKKLLRQLNKVKTE